VQASGFFALTREWELPNETSRAFSGSKAEYDAAEQVELEAAARQFLELPFLPLLTFVEWHQSSGSHHLTKGRLREILRAGSYRAPHVDDEAFESFFLAAVDGGALRSANVNDRSSVVLSPLASRALRVQRPVAPPAIAPTVFTRVVHRLGKGRV
jgi:hypothetical protein